MEKKLIVTSLDGFLIKSEAFVEPHRAWFDRAIAKTGDRLLERWKGHPEYFRGVEEAMGKILPEATQKERTRQARVWYQEDVIAYIKRTPEVVYTDVKRELQELKSKYKLALLTTNTTEYIGQILETAGLNGLYDHVIASETEKEPDKSALVQKICDEEKPLAYIGEKEETRRLFEEREVKTYKTLRELEAA